MSQPQGHSAAGGIVSMKNSNYTIGNQTHDLTVCIAVPQPNVPPRAPTPINKLLFIIISFHIQINTLYFDSASDRQAEFSYRTKVLLVALPSTSKTKQPLSLFRLLLVFIRSFLSFVGKLITFT